MAELSSPLFALCASTLNRSRRKQMDQYVPILKKCPRQPIGSALSNPITNPGPGKGSRNSLWKHQSIYRHLTLMLTKPPLQNPYASFTVPGARSGSALRRFIHHLPTSNLPPQPRWQMTSRYPTSIPGRWIKHSLVIFSRPLPARPLCLPVICETNKTYAIR